MCTVIRPETLIILILEKVRKISGETLYNFRSKLVEEYPEIIIDFSYVSFQNALENYQDFFVMNENEIEFNEEYKNPDVLIKEIKEQVDPTILTKISSEINTLSV